jgi:uncharacterized protein
MADDCEKLVGSFYEAFARRDIEGQLALFDTNAEWHSAESFIYAGQNPYVGLDALRALTDQVRSEWEEFHFIPLEVLGAGGTVITRGRYVGKFKANGARIDCEFVHVFRCKDGKITSVQTYTDTAHFRDAVQQVRENQSLATQG